VSDSTPLLLSQLADIWAIYEKMGLMVGTLWLNPTELPELFKHPDAFDRLDPHVRKTLIESGGAPGIPCQPGTPEGSLWGADVRCTTLVLDSHVVIAPSGMTVSALDKAACIKLGVTI